MGDPLEIDNLQDQVFGEKITKNEFEKYERLWIGLMLQKTEIIMAKFIILFSQISKFLNVCWDNIGKHCN